MVTVARRREFPKRHGRWRESGALLYGAMSRDAWCSRGWGCSRDVSGTVEERRFSAASGGFWYGL